MSVDKKISQLPVATTVNTTDYTVMVDGNTSTNKRATVAQILAASGGGTVTSVGITGTDGITVTDSPITSSGSITLALGSITPDAVTAVGAVSGSNLSGTNTGDQTITLSSDVAGSGTSSITTTIQPGVVTNAKLADMTGPTVKGRSSGTGAPSDLDMSTLNGMLPDMVGDSGSGGTHGLVPAPTSGSAAAKKFLRADATWVAPDANDLLPSQAGNSGKVLSTNGSTTLWAAAGVGSVTSVSVTTANGVSGTVATSTTTPAISLTLGAITPSSVAATGTVTGTNLSGTNTGDQTTITGNAGSATILQTARAINGVNFDGSAAITVTAAGSTLSDTVPIAKGGTGQITAQAAINALLPSQAGAAGKNLQSDGTNVSFVADAGGTVTSVAATAGTGISVSGSPITTSGTLTITNTAPDQIVALTGGTGITTSGTYPNFTVTNSAPDQTVALTASTGITTSGTYPNFTIANSAPDQTVAIAAGTGISVSGTYPSFTVTNSSPSSGGTVTSVAATVPSVFSISGSPITGAGTLAITYSGTALPVVNGGTGVTTSTGTTNVVLSGSPTITTPVIAQINDANGHATLRLTGITSATDYLEIKNGIGVGSPLHVLAEGASTNIGVHLQPKGSGLFTISDGTDFNKGIRFRSSSSAASAVTLIDAVSTAGRVVTLPDATDTLVGRATTDTLTNKTLTSPTLTLAGVGIATSASTNLNILGSTTTVSSLRIIPGVAPTSPVNGDVWSTSAGAFIRINNTTYQFGSLP